MPMPAPSGKSPGRGGHRRGLFHTKVSTVKGGGSPRRTHLSTSPRGSLLTSVQKQPCCKQLSKKFRDRYCEGRLPSRSVPGEQRGNASVTVRSTHVESRSRPPWTGFRTGNAAAPKPLSRGGAPAVGALRLRPPWSGGPRPARRRSCADSDKARERLCHSVTSDPHRAPCSSIPAVQRLVLAVSTDITCASWCMCDEPPLDFSEPER